METHKEKNGKALCGAQASSYRLKDRYFNCEKCKQILLDSFGSGPWKMFANRYESGKFCHVGSHFYVKCHGGKEEPIPVLVELCDEGEYYGWQDIDDNPAIPCMIWKSKLQFEMCFAGGSQSHVDRKLGKVVRLKITEREGE